MVVQKIQERHQKGIPDTAQVPQRGADKQRERHRRLHYGGLRQSQDLQRSVASRDTVVPMDSDEEVVLPEPAVLSLIGHHSRRLHVHLRRYPTGTRQHDEEQ